MHVRVGCWCRFQDSYVDCGGGFGVNTIGADMRAGCAAGFIVTGFYLYHVTTEALADGAADTSSSGGSSSRGSEQASGPPPPVAFFHRIFSSDLSRARETAELIVQELLDGQHGGDSGGEQAATAAAEGVIGFDRDLREILGGAWRGWRVTSVMYRHTNGTKSST